MSKHDRNLLKINAIELFAAFAANVGAQVRPGKGPFQLLQVKTSGPDWHAICKNATNVVTTPPALRDLIQQFNVGRSDPREYVADLNGSQVWPPRQAKKKADQQYADDLRDDAAIRFMSALLLKCTDPTALQQEHILSTAKLSYRMADALLVAGGHRE